MPPVASVSGGFLNTRRGGDQIGSGFAVDAGSMFCPLSRFDEGVIFEHARTKRGVGLLERFEAEGVFCWRRHGERVVLEHAGTIDLERAC